MAIIQRNKCKKGRIEELKKERRKDNNVYVQFGLNTQTAHTLPVKFYPLLFLSRVQHVNAMGI